MQKFVRLCSVPGCVNTISADRSKNRTGVCRDHNHTRPYCQCRQCEGLMTRESREAQAEAFRRHTRSAFPSLARSHGNLLSIRAQLRAKQAPLPEDAPKKDGVSYDLPDARTSSLADLCRPISGTVFTKRHKDGGF